MNQNRSWPGVPNRYKDRSDRKVIRPKSMATVVVVLPATPLMSSTPTLRSLSVSSVRSGRISLTALTRVVLPTPNPPAMRILAVVGGTGSPRAYLPDRAAQGGLAHTESPGDEDLGRGRRDRLVGAGLRVRVVHRARPPIAAPWVPALRVSRGPGLCRARAAR